MKYAAVLLLLVQGCLGHGLGGMQRIEGWPVLEERIHRVDAEKIWPYCKAAMTPLHWVLLALPVACAYFDFEAGTCDVYVAKDTGEHMIEIELLHCRGWHHDQRMFDYFERWRKERQVTNPT